ncbi:hypothetical protein EVAR_55332_1 [Eumeta japonica]|uniref:Uncharacterized protein n=1 Tax=Eumeta variegata TaxID=151549 RepID=A0A4C1ZPN8_EUMVA|nr:hypothetical protein EVAR_55332_1 [Eumeta japonica]
MVADHSTTPCPNYRCGCASAQNARSKGTPEALLERSREYKCLRESWSDISSSRCNLQQIIIVKKGNSKVGMQSNLLEHIEAVRKYYAAFPALKKGQNSPEHYYMPPPAWCRKPAPVSQVNMQADLQETKDWHPKNKKLSSGKERRYSYHGQQRRSNKKKYYNRSFESKENLPEWMTHEGVWDMDAQDPIREFIRAMALDEGYSTCENTVAEELRELAKVNMKQPKVPDLDDNLDIDTHWNITEDLISRARTPMEEELYAKFEAKFNHSIEALWSKDQANTPDDEYQDLPIDFQDLLSSPTDQRFLEPSMEKCNKISLTENIWSNDTINSILITQKRKETPTKSIEILDDRFKPLNLADNIFTYVAEPSVKQEEPIPLNNNDSDPVPSVDSLIYSFILLNHSKDHSSFTEVIPRRPVGMELGGSFGAVGCGEVRGTVSSTLEPPREDLLTSARTHFRPICREAGAPDAGVRYTDGTTFDINGDLDPVKYHRSESGYMYLESEEREGAERPCCRYLEYRFGETFECDGDPNEFRLKFAVCHLEKAVQTEMSNPSALTPIAESAAAPAAAAAWGLCDECVRRAGAKKMRQSGVDSIWSAEGGGEQCGSCATRVSPSPVLTSHPPNDELSRDWEELLSDISAAHAQYVGTEVGSNGEGAGIGEGGSGGGDEGWWRGDRKRRHSAALRCARAHGTCPHPHAPFLHCCILDRPLTR